MATGGFLVNVEKLDPAEMEEWRSNHPDVFARAANWDPAYGETFSDWVAEGGD